MRRVRRSEEGQEGKESEEGEEGKESDKGKEPGRKSEIRLACIKEREQEGETIETKK